jgi:hypothetical protein
MNRFLCAYRVVLLLLAASSLSSAMNEEDKHKHRTQTAQQLFPPRENIIVELSTREEGTQPALTQPARLRRTTSISISDNDRDIDGKQLFEYTSDASTDDEPSVGRSAGVMSSVP